MHFCFQSKVLHSRALYSQDAKRPGGSHTWRPLGTNLIPHCHGGYADSRCLSWETRSQVKLPGPSWSLLYDMYKRAERHQRKPTVNKYLGQAAPACAQATGRQGVAGRGARHAVRPGACRHLAQRHWGRRWAQAYWTAPRLQC